MTLLSHEKLDVVLSTKDGEIAKYKLELEVPGALSKSKRRESIQSVKKNASFKGFRKGTIPPFIMKEIDSFVLNDVCNTVIEEATKELQLSAIDGEEAQPKMDLEEMKKRFNIGEDFYFTCEVQLQAANFETPFEELEDVVTIDVDDISTVDVTKPIDAQ